MKENRVNFLTVFIALSLFSIGLFYEYLSCMASVILCIYIVYFSIKNKAFHLKISLASISVFLVVISYGVTAIWAIDSGDAVIGFFKFLPIILFVLLLMQEKEGKPNVNVIPYSMAVMTVVSSVLSLVPNLKQHFTVSDRLSGFLQYSNTFALLLLVSLVIMLTAEKHRRLDYLVMPVLIFGILYSGSRTVFILMLAVLAFTVFAVPNKKVKIPVLLSVIAIVVVAVIYATLTDNFDTFARFLTTSVKSSTFLGRFLYFKDALPVIIRHPFGLGYMGYYYIQQSIQTGMYSVKFIHNDFLQLLLDIGWVPTVLFVSAIIKSFFRKGNSLRNRLLLLVICAHCCFDFDLQYVVVFIILTMLLDYDDATVIKLDVPYAVSAVTVSIVAVMCVYVGTAQALYSMHMNTASEKLYPWNTQALIEDLTNAKNVEDMDRLADKIISNNSFVPVAYSAKANAAFSEGDIESVIRYKNKVFDLAVFSQSEYEQYCYMMIHSAEMYKQYGDYKSAEICLDELFSAIDRLQDSENRLSSLGKMINDQPDFSLPQDIIEYTEANRYGNKKSQ